MKIRTTEGDINESLHRDKFKEKQLSNDTKTKLLEDEKYFLKQALSTPCLNVAKESEGIYIIDNDGRKIIDFHGNSVHQLGYNHPILSQVLKDQLDKLSFSPRRYSNDIATECAKKLVSYMPTAHYKVLFTTSGAVSNETALKLSRVYTGKHKTLAATDSFHGATFTTISVAGTEHFKKGLSPLLEYCETFPHFTQDDKENVKTLKFIEEKCKNDDIGAIIIEPVRCTDVILPKKEYLKTIRRICDDYNVTLIFDEIPTAFGRCGTMFSFENFDVTPDILTLGKGMAGGLIPFSAVVAHEKFDICNDTSMGHYTFEKNPLGASVTVALIDEVSKLLERSNEIGHILKREILNFNNRCIHEVRNIGALVAVEIFHENKETSDELAEIILYKALAKGLSFKVSCGNILILSPPLIISDEQLSHAVDILKESLCIE